MQPREFLRQLPRVVRPALPPELAGFRTSGGFSLAQVWYGNRAIHYEAWLRSRLHVIELGLHFEADPLTNARLLAAFQAQRTTVKRALGDEARIEPWDKGWARVWEPVSLDTLDGDFLARVGQRMASYVIALEPLLRDALPADIAWAEPETKRERPDPVRAARYARGRRRPQVAGTEEGPDGHGDNERRARARRARDPRPRLHP
jgi:hypothetical protein